MSQLPPLPKRTECGADKTRNIYGEPIDYTAAQMRAYAKAYAEAAIASMKTKEEENGSK